MATPGTALTPWDKMTPLQRVKNIPAQIKQNFAGTKAAGIVGSIDDAFDYKPDTGLTWVTPEQRAANAQARSAPMAPPALAPQAVIGPATPANTHIAIAQPGAQAAAQSAQPGVAAAPTSPQAIFDHAKANGLLTPEWIAAGHAKAAEMKTTFDPETGYSRQPYEDSLAQGQAAPAALAPGTAQFSRADGTFSTQNRAGRQSNGIPEAHGTEVFDKMSGGTYGTPMTGMRAIDPQTGQPMGAQAIEAANRLGIPLSYASVPEAPAALAPNDPIRNTNELTGFNPAYPGQSLSDYMAGNDNPQAATIQGNDYQGRLRRFDSPAALAQNLEQGRANYDAASEARSNSIQFRRDQPGGLNLPPRGAYGTNPAAVSDRDRRGDALSRADANDIAGSSAGGRALIVQGRNAQALYDNSPQRMDADYRAEQGRENAYLQADLQKEAMDYRYDKIQQASDESVLQQINAINQASGQPLVSDPNQARTELFKIGQQRVTQQEQGLKVAKDNMLAIQQQTVDGIYAQALEGNGKLNEDVQEVLAALPGWTVAQAVDYIATLKDNKNSESARLIAESAPASAEAMLAQNPDYDAAARQAQQLYFAALREAQENPSVSTNVGIPTVQPYTTGLSPEQMAAAQQAFVAAQ